MYKEAVIAVVKNIFTYRGYIISSSEICDLIAQKDKDYFLIKIETEPNFNNLRYFSNRIQKYGKGLVISESYDDNTRRFALDNGLILWDRRELELHLGETVLEEILKKYNEKSREKPEEKLQEKIDSIFSSMHEINEVNQSVIKEYEKTIRVMISSIPINIGKKDALTIAEAKIGLPKKQELKFIPVWYYTYSFAIKKKYKSKSVDLSDKGEGYINALTGENSFIKYTDIRDHILMPTQNYVIKQAFIKKKEASDKALNCIIREHTKEVRLNEMIGDTIVFENRNFAPEPSEININIDLLHIPVWEIKGKREIIDIDGYDGHIMSIKLYNDAELVK